MYCEITLHVFGYLPSGSYMYHLRVYVYQARNLCAMDKDSFSGKNKAKNFCLRITRKNTRLDKEEYMTSTQTCWHWNNTLVHSRSLCPCIISACEQDHRSHKGDTKPHMGSNSNLWGHWNLWRPPNCRPQPSWCSVGAVRQRSSCTYILSKKAAMVHGVCNQA